MASLWIGSGTWMESGLGSPVWDFGAVSELCHVGATIEALVALIFMASSVLPCIFYSPNCPPVRCAELMMYNYPTAHLFADLAFSVGVASGRLAERFGHTVVGAGPVTGFLPLCGAGSPYALGGARFNQSLILDPDGGAEQVGGQRAGTDGAAVGTQVGKVGVEKIQKLLVLQGVALGTRLSDWVPWVPRLIIKISGFAICLHSSDRFQPFRPPTTGEMLGRSASVCQRVCLFRLQIPSFSKAY